MKRTAAELLAPGSILRERREAAGLSRAALAAITHLSESTIKNLEHGRNQPTQSTLSALLAVQALGLRPEDLLLTPPASVTPPAPGMNSYLPPGVDPMQTVADIRKVLQGSGGVLEQSSLYLDHAGATAWFALANQPAYAARRELRHLGAVAQEVGQRLGPVGSAGLDVIGLGCGDGHKEVRLVQELCALSRPPAAMRLFLLDLSQPLLSHAFRTASKAGISAFAIQGDFHQLPQYIDVMDRVSGSRRLLCLFGGTFGNLNNEVKFLQNNLQGLESGDFLLLHVGQCYADAVEPVEVRRLDPHLNSSTPRDVLALQRQWLCGPIERYGREVGAPLPDLEVQTRFDSASCVVPGSYAIEFAVLVKEPGRSPRRFVVTYVKRYEPNGLSSCLEALGWKALKTYEEPGNDLLALFQRH